MGKHLFYMIAMRSCAQALTLLLFYTAMKRTVSHCAQHAVDPACLPVSAWLGQDILIDGNHVCNVRSYDVLMTAGCAMHMIMGRIYILNRRPA